MSVWINAVFPNWGSAADHRWQNFGNLALGSAVEGLRLLWPMQAQTEARSPEWTWPFWPVVPLYPYGQRRTLCREVIPDTIWVFDQIQGIFYVTVPIRMTVVRLADGGLLVYAPIAPTPECVRLVRSLEAQHGDVTYIILPTVSGVEHKVFVGPFARRFPAAEVLVSPHQWSFPLDLPLSWLGFPGNRTRPLPDPDRSPFGDEFDYARLGPISLGLGTFEEVALFHKPSNTLLVTDTVLSISTEPPEVVQIDPYPLLFHARETAFELIEDSLEARRKGWQRTTLFASYFRPSALDVVSMGQALRDAAKAPDRSPKAYFGFYPFRWRAGWERSFHALQGEGRLRVAPILQQLVLNRGPKAVEQWLDRVTAWSFERIIPCHFTAPISATPELFRQAFSFLSRDQSSGDQTPTDLTLLPEVDFAFLQDLETGLIKRGIARPAGELGYRD